MKRGEPVTPAEYITDSNGPGPANRPASLPIAAHHGQEQRPAVEPITLATINGARPAVHGDIGAPGPSLQPLLDGTNRGAVKSNGGTPAVIRLPLGRPDTPSDPAAVVHRGVGQIATLPALPIPPPSDRLTALALIREATHENFVLRFDGQPPRLLTRAEAIRALEAGDTPQVILLPLNDQDAEAVGRWIDQGRSVGTPDAWLTNLQQSAASRARHHDRRQTELDRVRAERNKLRDSMYRLLLRQNDPVPNPADSAPATQPTPHE